MDKTVRNLLFNFFNSFISACGNGFQLISLNLEVGLYLGVGALIWDYDRKPVKQLLTYSRADLTRFCIYWFSLSLKTSFCKSITVF